MIGLIVTLVSPAEQHAEKKLACSTLSESSKPHPSPHGSLLKTKNQRWWMTSRKQCFADTTGQMRRTHAHAQNLYDSLHKTYTSSSQKKFPAWSVEVGTKSHHWLRSYRHLKAAARGKVSFLYVTPTLVGQPHSRTDPMTKSS